MTGVIPFFVDSRQYKFSYDETLKMYCKKFEFITKYLRNNDITTITTYIYWKHLPSIHSLILVPLLIHFSPSVAREFSRPWKNVRIFSRLIKSMGTSGFLKNYHFYTSYFGLLWETVTDFLTLVVSWRRSYEGGHHVIILRYKQN